jgi:predicted nucleic acid-binding protein
LNVNLDTCSFIHLAQGGVLDIVLELRDQEFFVGPIVRGEVQQLKTIVDRCITNLQISVLPDDELIFDDVADFSNQHNLGVGESECILFCLRRKELNVCSDDRRARLIGANVLSSERVVGTSDLLKECVRQGMLTAQDSFAAYEQMRARGAFLPPLGREEFII